MNAFSSVDNLQITATLIGWLIDWTDYLLFLNNLLEKADEVKFSELNFNSKGDTE